MKLKQLLTAIKYRAEQVPDVDITDLVYDSRKAVPGCAFVCLRGANADGHKYAKMAAEKGAAVIIAEEIVEAPVPVILTDNTRLALAYLSAEFFGHPAEQMHVIGITGTKGKTTTAFMMRSILEAAGHKTGVIGTIGVLYGDTLVQTDNTTPENYEVQKFMRQMVDAGCAYAFMEVSSHSAAQHRIAGLDFNGAIFTNLTRDHIDYHKTVEAYLKAKKSFFDGLPKGAFALTNIDDKSGLVMLQNTKAEKHTYSLRTLADFRVRIIESRIDGMTLEINGKEVEVMFVGKFNAYNLLAVYGAACLLGQEPEEVLRKMSLLVPVAGRFQTLHSSKGYTAIVDYAHTPDALNNVLSSIRDVLGNRGHIITVVGAGGNRDKGKRPMMAREAVNLSDRVILTSDNPRFENPNDILNDMLEGLDAEQRRKTLAIVDRREAIRAATQFAQPGDVVLIAGKGHEDYQEIEGVKHHFDDKEEVEKLFAEERI